MTSARASLERSAIRIGDRSISYQVRDVRSSGGMRVRVGLDGVSVLRPLGRENADPEDFLKQHSVWVFEQLDRMERLRAVRRSQRLGDGEILLHGDIVKVTLELTSRSRHNRVRFCDDRITITKAVSGDVTAASSLERWLRQRARTGLAERVAFFSEVLHVDPGRLYIMEQRTKWGNCSNRHNLSFNWRLVMAPNHVLEYLVAHEVLHIAIPDHSQKFWLTLQSVYPESERARQWLVANSDLLLIDLGQVVTGGVQT